MNRAPEQMDLARPQSDRHRAMALIAFGCLLWSSASLLFAGWLQQQSMSPAFLGSEFSLVVAGAASVLVGWLRLTAHESIRIENGAVVVRSGKATRSLETSDDQVVEVEIERRGTAMGPAFVWGIYLSGAGKREPVVVRNEYFLQFRNLAEMLARGLNCPLLDKSVEGPPLHIPASDLDLPFRERVRRHPQLLGDAVQCPQPLPLHRSAEDGTVKFSWRGSILRATVHTLLLALLLAVLIYLPVGLAGLSPQTVFGDRQLSTAVCIFAVLTVVGVIAPLAYQARLTLAPQAIEFQQSFRGLWSKHQTIPLSELEEIRVFYSGTREKITLFSDREQINLGTAFDVASQRDVACWLAHEIRAWAAEH